MAKLGETDLKALVANEIRASVSYDDAELSEKRRLALAYYEGTMTDVPAERGRSSVVSRDVADTIGWMLPGIIRVFTASDRMAVCDPVGDEDEEIADQATDGINYVFWKDNPGYSILYDATWDSLTLGNGIVKHWWDDTPEIDVSEHSGLTDIDLAKLLSDDGVRVLTHTATEEMGEMPDPMTGQMGQVPVTKHDVKIEKTKSRGRIKVECIKPDSFMLDRDAVRIADARFAGHRERFPRSDLIEMGFDANKINGLQAGLDDTPEAIERGTADATGVAHDSMVMVDLYECYVRADVDGDGVAETVRCYYAGEASGGELLDWEVWEDEVPFSDIPCYPIPHKWAADSVADETMDVQRVKTVLLRQGLDNIYAANVPRMEAEEDSVINPDELFNPTFGGVVWRKQGSQPIVPHAVPFVAKHVFEAIEYQDQVIERRTGVSRTTMALDPEALQNQTATANQNARDSAYSQIELIARNQAELGWKPVFRAILRLMIKHQDEARTVRLRNKTVQIDPRHWNADMDVTISVGLGTGSRDRDMQMLQVILQNQTQLADRLASAGMMEEAVQLLPFIRTTLAKSAESAGLKSPEQFYPEVTEDMIKGIIEKMQAKAGQPDPKVKADQDLAMFEVQSKAQLEQMKAQVALQSDAQKGQQQLALEEQQARADMATKDREVEAQAALEQRKFEFARELKLLEFRLKAVSEGKPEVADEIETSMMTTGSASGPNPLVQAIQQQGEMLAALVQQMNAPKTVMRDAAGKVVGIQTVGT